MMTNAESNENILDADGNPIGGNAGSFSQSQAELGTETAENEAVAGSINPDQASNETEVETLQRQLAEAEDRAVRSQAELDNFRKRTRREMDERAKFASLTLMNEILLSIDNLQLAVGASQTSGETEGLLEGVKMVSEQLVATLAKHGCEKIESVGQLFDPNQHEAVQMQPNAETPANHVSVEVRSGYKLHDRVIRPSQVFVSTGAPE